MLQQHLALARDTVHAPWIQRLLYLEGSLQSKDLGIVLAASAAKKWNQIMIKSAASAASLGRLR